jgi:hypothetical protein
MQNELKKAAIPFHKSDYKGNIQAADDLFIGD